MCGWLGAGDGFAAEEVTLTGCYKPVSFHDAWAWANVNGGFTCWATTRAMSLGLGPPMVAVDGAHCSFCSIAPSQVQIFYIYAREGEKISEA